MKNDLQNESNPIQYSFIKKMTKSSKWEKKLKSYNTTTASNPRPIA